MPDALTFIETLAGGLGAAAALTGTPGIALLAVGVAAGIFCILFADSRADLLSAGLLPPSAVRGRRARPIVVPLCDPAADGRPRARAPAARHRAASPSR